MSTGRSARERDPVTSSGPILLPNHLNLKVLFYLNYDEAVNFHRNVSNKHPNFAKLLSTIHFFVEEAVWVKIIINKRKPNPKPCKRLISSLTPLLKDCCNTRQGRELKYFHLRGINPNDNRGGRDNKTRNKFSPPRKSLSLPVDSFAPYRRTLGRIFDIRSDFPLFTRGLR